MSEGEGGEDRHQESCVIVRLDLADPLRVDVSDEVEEILGRVQPKSKSRGLPPFNEGACSVTWSTRRVC